MTLELQGRAFVAKIDGKKEGAGADKALALHITLRLTTDAGVLAHFHATLRSTLFDDDGEPRMANLKPLQLVAVIRNMLLDLGEVKDLAAECSRFVLQPLPGERVVMHFRVVLFPPPAQAPAIYQTLATEVPIWLRAASELIEGEKTEPHQTSAPEKGAKPPKAKGQTSLIPPSTAPQATWPVAGKGGVYDAATGERFSWTEGAADTADVIAAQVIVLQVGPAAWVNGVDLSLPGEDAYSEPPRPLEQPFESRRVALMDAARFIVGECGAWLKKHQKRAKPAPAGRTVEALAKWADALQDSPEPNPAPAPAAPANKKPKVATKRARKVEK